MDLNAKKGITTIPTKVCAVILFPESPRFSAVYHPEKHRSYTTDSHCQIFKVMGMTWYHAVCRCSVHTHTLAHTCSVAVRILTRNYPGTCGKMSTAPPRCRLTGTPIAGGDRVGALWILQCIDNTGIRHDGGTITWKRCLHHRRAPPCKQLATVSIDCDMFGSLHNKLWRPCLSEHDIDPVCQFMSQMYRMAYDTVFVMTGVKGTICLRDFRSVATGGYKSKGEPPIPSRSS